MSVNHSLVKFRPVLTLAQLRDIANMCREHEAQIESYPNASAILKVVVPMIAKVEVGAISPAYKLSETKILKDAEIAERQRYENNLMSAEEEAEYESKVMGI